MKIILLIIALALGVWFLGAWWLMLGIGDAHRDYSHAIPLMSFHVALILSVFFSGITGGSAAASQAGRK